MIPMTRTGEDVFAGYTSAGAARRVVNAEAQTWATEIEHAVSSALGLASGVGLVYSTRAALYADLAHGSNTAAMVIGDPTVAYNGIYMKSGASGAGSWSWVYHLPFQVIPLTATGSANAIVATSLIPVPPAGTGAFVIFTAPFTNTGAVTIAVNGAAAVALVDSDGTALPSGALTIGRSYVAMPVGSGFRLTVESDLAAALAAAAASASAAAASAAAAESDRNAVDAVVADLADLFTLQDNLGGMTLEGAAANLFSAIGMNEGRAAIGLGAFRITLTSLDSYVVNPAHFIPVCHYFYNNSASSICHVDVSTINAYQPYLFVNDGAAGSLLRLEAGASAQFRGTGRSPTSSAEYSIDIGGGGWAILVRVGGDRIMVLRPSDDGFWAVSSYASYRMTADGTYEVVYRRPASSSIAATSESTANSLPSWMDCSAATVLSVTYGTVAGGGPPPASPCAVTKLGTPHGLANNYTFAIYNPNASTVSHPVHVRMIGVRGQ